MQKNNFEIKTQVPLADMTSLGVGGNAEFFVEVTKDENLISLVRYAKEKALPIFILGEGSNLLVSDKGIKGLVVKLMTTEIKILTEDETSITLRVDGGLSWDKLVSHTVTEGWWGLENMSLIPGTVGACPVQNVGAFGQECQNVINAVHVFDILEEEFKVFDNSSCRFGFRESIFNTTDKNRYIIVKVDFLLSKHPKPILSRPELMKGIKQDYNGVVSQKAIRDLVIRIRTSGKSLPADSFLGSAGTFFRTTVVSLSQLLSTFIKSTLRLGPKIGIVILVFGWKYRNSQGYRVPSRMLIDACGLANSASGPVSLFHSNSAVIVTDKRHKLNSSDILKLVKDVRRTVYKQTGFRVPIEPTLVGFEESELKEIFFL